MNQNLFQGFRSWHASIRAVARFPRSPLALINSVAIVAIALMTGCRASAPSQRAAVKPFHESAAAPQDAQSLDSAKKALDDYFKNSAAQRDAAGPAATNTAGQVLLREPDMLKVAFPGAPNMDVTQPIRRDGKITLPLIGEVTAVGLAPSDLQETLKKQYDPILVTKEVTVTLLTQTYPIFITGAVIRPGRVLADHPLNVLQAVMEAGGFDYSKANLKSVRVLRKEGDKMKSYTVNLKKVLEGKSSSPMYIAPDDIIFVPERFVWF